jgi:hypothetical protein
MAGSAIFSSDVQRGWRYRLTREWDAALPTVNFVGLNPSTADEMVADPTVRRCLGFARKWGFGKLLMTNIFAWRATDPSDMRRQADPIGQENDEHLRQAAREAQMVVACWGEGGRHRERWREVEELLEPRVRCLGTNLSGQPKHPLYLAGDLEPELFCWPSA